MSNFMIVFLGSLIMLVPIVIVAHCYKIPMWKGAVVSLLLCITGMIGTYILFYAENGHIEGRSFYGAVFFVPVVFVVIARVMRIPYGEIMDLCAPAECIMLVLMKANCLAVGCCDGRVICTSSNGTDVIFPSQMAELINALIIMLILLGMSRKEKNLGRLYPWYMIIYGASRFVLNLFRGNTTPFALGLPAGNFWSLVAIAIGIPWLVVLSRKKTEQRNN